MHLFDIATALTSHESMGDKIRLISRLNRLSFSLTAAYDKLRHPSISLDVFRPGLWGISLDDAFV